VTARQLESLYDAHAQSLFAFLLHLTRCEETTRDLLQEAFLRLSRRTLPPLLKPRSYLLRLAHHVWIDHVRRETSRSRALETAAHDPVFLPPPETTADSELAAQLVAGLTALPPDQRAVVHLKIWESLTFREVGAALGIPTHTAASRYRYALDKLRATIRPSLENERA
jgi:RNA polymerase sigma-70 factor (ECF subfamily)